MRKLIVIWLMASLLFACDNQGQTDEVKTVKINDELEVFLTGEATEEEGLALGEYLEENELVIGEKLQLDKEENEYTVSLLYDEEKYEDNKEGYLFTFANLPSQLSKNVFEGESTRVLLADESFDKVAEVETVKKAKINSTSTVYFKGKIVEDQARRLGKYLLDIKYFDNESVKDVILTDNHGEYVIRFIVDRKKYKENKAEALNDFKVYQHLISTFAFGGQKSNLILTDTRFRDIEKVGELTSREKAEISNMIDKLQNPELYQTDSSMLAPPDSTATNNKDTTYRQ